jgi:hypothetical protein
MTHEQIAEVIAGALKPVFEQGRRDLQSALKEIAHKPTDAMNRPLRESDLQRIMRDGFGRPNDNCL